MNEELSRIRRNVDQKIDEFEETVRADVTDEISELKCRVNSLKNNSTQPDNGVAKSVISRGLPSTHREDMYYRLVYTNLF